MSTAHKLAKQIRDLDVQDSISLDGVSDAQVADLVDQSFATPIPAPEMIRVQFIVGGGKKCRARFALKAPARRHCQRLTQLPPRGRYAPDLPKQLSEELRRIGFTEDRGASAVLECQARKPKQRTAEAL